MLDSQHKLKPGLERLTLVIQDLSTEEVIIPTASVANSPTWPVLKPGKNERCFVVDHHTPNAATLPTEDPTPRSTEITDFFYRAMGDHSAGAGLTAVACSVPGSTASQLPKGHDAPLPGNPWTPQQRCRYTKPLQAGADLHLTFSRSTSVTSQGDTLL